MSDLELPGMWEEADFTGGKDDPPRRYVTGRNPMATRSEFRSLSVPDGTTLEELLRKAVKADAPLNATLEYAGCGSHEYLLEWTVEVAEPEPEPKEIPRDANPF